VHDNDPILAPPFDRSSLLAAVVVKRRWIILAGLGAMALGLAGAAAILKPAYTASVQLRRYDSPLASDVYRPQPIQTTALLGMISLPEVVHKTGTQLSPPQSMEELLPRIRLSEDRASELTTVTATGKTRASALQLANVFSEETVHFTQDMQRRDATEANALITKQLAVTENDRSAVLQQLVAMQSQEVRRTDSSSRRDQPQNAAAESADPYTRLTQRTQAARDQLAELEGRYTDAHPLVKEQKARVAALEAQLATTSRTAPVLGPIAQPVAGAARSPQTSIIYDNQSAPYVALALRLSEIEKTRSELVARQRATELFMNHPPGYFQELHLATEDEVLTRNNRVAIAVLGVLCGGFGAILAALIVTISELFDDRIKTIGDVKRVVDAPLIGTLRHLSDLNQAAKDQWGFGAWRGLQHRLSSIPTPGMVCGFTSSGPREGRTTWIELIAAAARRAGFRVLSGTEVSLPDASQWTVERRRQWQATVKTWEATENLVVLIELPPASDPRTVLIAENLPALVWISGSRQASASATLDQLALLRNAHCRVVAAGLNRDWGHRTHFRFARWIGRTAAVALLLGGLGSAQAQEAALTETPRASHAAWQQHLTLGPGDLLNLSVFGQPELLREQVPVGPDGRISYLEADGVMAAGLTVDELRAALSAELGKYRNSAEVVIVPAAYHSKKYYVLGAVAHRGAYPLERPMTIVEAVSAAGGLESGAATGGRSAAVPGLQVDLSRSTLARQGKHVPVDFERLFQQGDLSQNVPLEPGDYLYFPTGLGPEVYVLGEVRFPGAMAFASSTGALEAVASRGGFTPRAWKTRLLVIRGSLAHPETFVVDSNRVLAAQISDFALRPHDIVYVSRSPWQKVGEILDAGASAFVEAAVVTATGLHVDPIGGR
jgi:protein involved in polysaccharide export with SLBB domain/capsular polysaccharide biosynthesis protein